MFKYAFRIIALSFILHHCDAVDTDPVVKIKNGQIKGKLLKTFDKQIEYRAFFGIPYAKPPIGNLRFQESEVPDNWTGVLNTTDEKDICMQQATTIYGTAEIRGSEDCLYLNVYAPKIVNKPRKLLPVMFYVHGGGFIDGSNSIEDYGPDLFINNGVILVIIKYRLGVYGFLSTQDEACPGNNGLKDQVLALRWTKDNAKAFGGDPNKITIFGHSAGATCINYLLLSPLTKGLMRSAIMQSGSAIDYFARATNPAEKAFELGRKLDIHTNDSSELIRKLRNIDNDKSLYSTANSVATKFNDIDGSFTNYGPTIEHGNKNAFLTKKPLQQLIDGDFHRVPIITGHTTLEAQYFGALVSAMTWDITNNITHLVPNTLIPKDEATKKLVAEKIKEYYFKNTTGGFHEYDMLRYVSDNLFVRGILKSSRLFAKYIPSEYLYEFAYIGNLGNSDQNRKGVGHTEEINYMFHKAAESRNISKEDNVVRQELVKWWTNFAKSGNPTPPGTNLIWPILNEQTGYKSLIINNTNVLVKRLREEDIKFWDKMYKYDVAHVGWY